MSVDMDGFSYKCETKLRTEEKRVEWTIENFSAVVKQGLQNTKFTFSLGDSIGISSTGIIELETTGDTLEKRHSRFTILCVNNDQTDGDIYVKFNGSFIYASRIQNDIPAKAFLFHGCNSVVPLVGWFSSHSYIDLSNDIACFRLSLTLYGNETINEVKCNQSETNAMLEEESIQNITKDMQCLLDKPEHSDFVIKVPSDPQRSKYESFNVHKSILAARSEVFKVMFESTMKESQTGEVTFDDLNLDVLKTFLKFVYTGIVDDDWKNHPTEIVDISERFNLPSLKKFLDMNLHLICNVENVVDLLQLARYHCLTTAFKNISKYIQLNIREIVNP